LADFIEELRDEWSLQDSGKFERETRGSDVGRSRGTRDAGLKPHRVFAKGWALKNEFERELHVEGFAGAIRSAVEVAVVSAVMPRPLPLVPSAEQG